MYDVCVVLIVYGNIDGVMVADACDCDKCVMQIWLLWLMCVCVHVCV